MYVFVCAVDMQSSSLKLFANLDQKPMLLKRQAFAMFSGELDQYHLYLPLIQGMVLAIYYVDLFIFYVILFKTVVKTDTQIDYVLSLLLRASY